MRADEQEGTLNDTETKRQADRMQSHYRKVLRDDLSQLTENPAFLRTFGKFAKPCIMDKFSIDHGSKLAHFMGKRELVLDMISLFESDEPGFLNRVLYALDKLENDLQIAASPQKE